MYNRFSHMHSAMFFPWFIPLVIFLIIGLSFYMISKNNIGNKGKKESALDILDKRYANGEIDEEEYREKKKVLKEE